MPHRRPTFHWTNCLTACLVWFAAWAVISLIAGCAVGRNELTGAIVLGFEAGRLVETANQAVATGTEGVLGMLGLGAGPAGAIGVLAAKLYGDKEKARGDARAAEALREGEMRGWNEREAAATVQLPIPPPAPVVPPPVAST